MTGERRVGDRRCARSCPATGEGLPVSITRQKKVESVRHVHASDVAVNELLFPGGFCSSEHDSLGSLEVTFRRHSEGLAEKRSVPRRVVVYVFVQRFIDPREVEKSGDVEVGCDMSERLPGNTEEGCSTLWERRRVAVPVKVSMLGCLECGGFGLVVLVESVSGNLCGLVEHKLRGGEEHELRSSTHRDGDDLMEE